MYLDISNPEEGKVDMSSEITHCCPQVKLSEDGLKVAGTQGYRTCKSNYGVSTGTFLYELKIVDLKNKTGMVRFGWSQISASLRTAVGFDVFGYSFRGNPPSLFHRSRSYPADIPFGNIFLSPKTKEEGDIVATLIHLPKLNKEQTDELCSRNWNPEDPYKPLWYKVTKQQSDKRHRYSKDYTRDLMRIKDSRILFFVNGKLVKTAFQDIYLGSLTNIDSRKILPDSFMLQLLNCRIEFWAKLSLQLLRKIQSLQNRKASA